MERHIFEIRIRLWKSQCSRYVPEMQEKDKAIESLNFLLFTFCNNYLFAEVSNNKVFDFLTSNSCFFNFCYWGFHDKRESIAAVPRWKKVEEHCSRATFNKVWSKSYVCHKLSANLLSAKKVSASCVKHSSHFLTVCFGHLNSTAYPCV